MCHLQGNRAFRQLSSSWCNQAVGPKVDQRQFNGMLLMVIGRKYCREFIRRMFSNQALLTLSVNEKRWFEVVSAHQATKLWHDKHIGY